MSVPPTVETDDQSAEIHAFLSGGGSSAAVKRAPVPQSEFSPQDWPAMLEQHNNIDVMTAERLRKWRAFALSRLVGEQPKIGREAAFKDNPNITAAQRREVQMHREAGEEAALSLDVRIASISHI